MTSQKGAHRENHEARVSVIMPCYNAARFLTEAMDCVLNQSHPDVELIVVDDGSTDGSLEIIEAYGDRVKVLRQEHQGPYPARNLGLEEATGHYVAFLDADDWWAPDFLEKMLRALEARPECALAYCGWQNVGVPGGRGQPYVPPDYELEDKAVRFLRAASPWPIHAALVRRSVLQEVGNFQCYLPTCMDYDLWLRLAVSRPIVLVPEVLAFYRHHDAGQISSTQWKQAKNTWLVKRRFIREHPELVSHVSRKQLRTLVDGALLTRGYDNFWRRDLVSAQQIFRQSLRVGGWKVKDLRYLLPALLPRRLFTWLVQNRDS